MYKTILKTSIFAVAFAAFGTAQATDKLNYGQDGRGSIIRVSDYEGQTFLTFMKDVVKPALDEVAVEGYLVSDGSVAI